MEFTVEVPKNLCYKTNLLKQYRYFVFVIYNQCDFPIIPVIWCTRVRIFRARPKSQLGVAIIGGRQLEWHSYQITVVCE